MSATSVQTIKLPERKVAFRSIYLKSLRDYLTGYRDRRILQEEVVNEVLDELVESGAPRFVEVEGNFNVRGGMGTRVVARAGDLPESWTSG